MSSLSCPLLASFSSSTSLLSPTSEIPCSPFVPGMQIPIPIKKRSARNGAVTTMASAESVQIDKPTKLVTFLGKGGSGKTTSAIFAAQHYAMMGLKTCLVIHSQDPTADYLLNCKIGTSPITCNNNLSAVRLETTKMLLEPLNRVKEADARLNLTQGVLEGVVGEELGVLPGMDSIFASLALDRLVGFFTNTAQRKSQKDKFDIIIFDGIGAEETIRMIGSTSKARLYLKYLRKLAEKTDIGRLAGPSLLRLADEALSLSSRDANLNGKSSSEIWDYLEQALERSSSVSGEQQNFSCYVVMDPNDHLSANAALRYWGCAIQAGAQISGAFSFASPNARPELVEGLKKNISPLAFACIPHLPSSTRPDWNKILLNSHSQDARHLLSFTSEKTRIPSPVKFDPANRSITLLMPGFDKSEIKLFQFRGGSELLVEAGDQRRVINLPSQLQGKVGGAKFIERTLVITMR